MNNLMCLCNEAKRLVRPNTGHLKNGFVTGHPLRETFYGMRDRCYAKNSAAYADYGARGIVVSARWLLPRGEGFRNFVSDMGPRPDGHSLERIDVNGNYAPENCKWASNTSQQNNRRNNRRLTFNGETKTVSEWAAHIGMSYVTLQGRLSAMKWSVEKALTTPLLDPVAEAAKARSARTHCKRGHEFDEENTRHTKNGRVCRACAAMHMRGYRSATENYHAV